MPLHNCETQRTTIKSSTMWILGIPSSKLITYGNVHKENWSATCGFWGLNSVCQAWGQVC